jgi:hypothetical protein
VNPELLDDLARVFDADAFVAPPDEHDRLAEIARELRRRAWSEWLKDASRTGTEG